MTPQIQQVGEDTIRVRAGDVTAVVSDTCPHRGGRLRYAHVDGDRRLIRCPLHSSAFDLQTGRRVAGPSCGAIAVHSYERDAFLREPDNREPGEPT